MYKRQAEHNIKWEALVTHGTGDATKLAGQAVESGYDLIVSYGGDGTLMEVVNGLMGQDLSLIHISEPTRPY